MSVLGPPKGVVDELQDGCMDGWNFIHNTPPFFLCRYTVYGVVVHANKAHRASSIRECFIFESTIPLQYNTTTTTTYRLILKPSLSLLYNDVHLEPVVELSLCVDVDSLDAHKYTLG